MRVNGVSWATVILLAAAAWAGCVTPAGAPDQDGARDDGGADVVPDRVEYRGCREHQGIFFAPEAPFLAAMPEGFRPATVAPGLVGWSLFSYECARVDGPWESPVGPVREGMAIVSVEPPAHLASPDAMFHIVMLGVVSDNALTAGVFESWGVPDVHVGAVNYDEQVSGPVRFGEAEGDAGDATFSLATTATGEPQPWNGRVLRLYGLNGPLDPAAPPHVTDVVDVTVHDRGSVGDGSSSYALPGTSNPLARLVPASGTGLGSHWEMASDAVAFSYERVGLPAATGEGAS